MNHGHLPSPLCRVRSRGHRIWGWGVVPPDAELHRDSVTPRLRTWVHTLLVVFIVPASPSCPIPVQTIFIRGSVSPRIFCMLFPGHPRRLGWRQLRPGCWLVAAYLWIPSTAPSLQSQTQPSHCRSPSPQCPRPGSVLTFPGPLPALPLLLLRRAF